MLQWLSGVFRGSRGRVWGYWEVSGAFKGCQELFRAGSHKKFYKGFWGVSGFQVVLSGASGSLRAFQMAHWRILKGLRVVSEGFHESQRCLSGPRGVAGALRDGLAEQVVGAFKDN